MWWVGDGNKQSFDYFNFLKCLLCTFLCRAPVLSLPSITRGGQHNKKKFYYNTLGCFYKTKYIALLSNYQNSRKTNYKKYIYNVYRKIINSNEKNEKSFLNILINIIACILQC